MKRLSICPSVCMSVCPFICLSHHLAAAAACSGFAAERRVGKRYRSTAAATRPPAAAVPAVNASSVTLTADVGS